MTTRADCLGLDLTDPLAPLRDQFALPAGVIYLDGNSLGALPRSASARLREVTDREWGEGLIRSWNSAGWIDLAQRVGDKIARVIGAAAGEVVVADSTSVNLYKVLCAALDLVRTYAPQRTVVVTDRDNFPTDLYITQSVVRERGLTLRLVEPRELLTDLDARVALVALTQVNYRSGRLHPMAPVNRAAHAAGALTVWDLSHSAGVVPVALHDDEADFAVGCGYKYLNGGPGAPAYVWVHPRHMQRMEAHAIGQPLTGWLGHASPFAFAPDYRPAPGIGRFVCGTPPILSLAAMECGVDTHLAAGAYGGIDALRRKSVALTDCFIALADERCGDTALALATPRDAHERGSQVSFACDDDAYAIMQALIDRGVIGDFRAPDLLRFGVAPLYNRFVDVWDAVEALRDVLSRGEWRAARHRSRAPVT
jgi:kynureninase